MSFLNPEYLWLFLFIVAMFIKEDSRNLRATSYGYLVTFVFIVLALTRPVIEQEPIKSQELLNDVVIAVDLSYSMQAKDLKPSRLESAKESLKELSHSSSSSRFGVVGFTTNAIVLSPLTEDSELLLHLFSLLDESLIMTKGSSVMPALKLARKLSGSPTLSVVLLSDGADALDYTKEALYAQENDIVVNVLMLASREGTTLKLPNRELLKDEFEDIVVSRENTNIELIAQKSGGVYTKELSDILSALKSQRDAHYKSNVTIVQNIELFYYFVFLAIVSFLLATTTLKRHILAFLLLFGVSLEADFLDFVKNKNRVLFEKGVEEYKSGEYEKALVAFRSVKSHKPAIKSLLYFNEGNALVRLKEFEKARVAYRKSLALSYSKEADENLENIREAQKEKVMSTGVQKAKKKSDLAQQRENSSKNSKQAGSSNMKVSAKAGTGASQAKKSKQNSRLSLNSSKTKLSSKQYELINKRQVNEKNPW